MKILITLSYFLPNISGLTNYAKNLSIGLIKRGKDVTILTSKHKNSLSDREVMDGIRVKRVWTPLIIGRGPIMPTYFVDAFIQIKKADVINIHLPQFEGFVTSLISKLLGKKIIVTYHCDLSFWRGFINVISTSFVYISNFISCILADKIVVNSKDYADASKFLRFFKNKLIYIYPPVLIAKPLGDVLKKHKNIKHKIGYVGRISKEKGITYLLESIEFFRKNLPDFKLFIAGPKGIVGGDQSGEIRDLLIRYRKHIILLGELSEGELYDFYRKIDVLVLPSIERQESFGMVQIEAMLSECPVLASDLPGVRDPISKTGMGIIFTPKDGRNLGEVIQEIIKNRNNYIKSVEVVKDIYNPDAVVSKYEKIFKGVSL